MKSEGTATISLQTLSGETITGRLTGVTRAPDGASPCAAVTARLWLSHATWRRVLAAGAFHLDGVDEPPGFEPEREVALDLRLRRALLPDVPDRAPDLEAALADPASPLAHTEAWLCIAAMQSVDAPTGQAELGIRTRWADPLGPREPEDLLQLVTTCLSSLGIDHQVTGGGDTGAAPVAMVTFTAHAGDRTSGEEAKRSGASRRPDYPIDDRSWQVVIRLDRARGQATIYSVHPRPVPLQARPGIALLLVEANSETGAAAFEMDPTDGEVRLRTELRDPSLARFQELLDGNLTTMATYYDAAALPLL